LSLIPGEGGIRRFSGTGELTFRRKGSTIAQGKLFARGDVTPGPAIEADLELASARVILPWLTGDVLGQTRLRVTTTRFHVDALTLTLPQGRVGLDPKASMSVGPIRLNAIASATLEGKEPRLEVRGFDLGGLLLARGRLGGSTLEEMSGILDGSFPGSNG